MGVDYYGKQILGVRIKNHHATTTTRGCDHKETASKFCPDCGAKMWESSIQLHPILQKIHDPYDNTDKLSLMWSTDEKECFVGYFYRKTGTSRGELGHTVKTEINKKFLDVDKTKEELKEVLKDLYQESEFGLWMLLYCSY